MEVLLQKMFEKELGVNELGPTVESLDEDFDENYKKKHTVKSAWHFT